MPFFSVVCLIFVSFDHRLIIFLCQSKKHSLKGGTSNFWLDTFLPCFSLFLSLFGLSFHENPLVFFLLDVPLSNFNKSSFAHKKRKKEKYPKEKLVTYEYYQFKINWMNLSPNDTNRKINVCDFKTDVMKFYATWMLSIQGVRTSFYNFPPLKYKYK